MHYPFEGTIEKYLKATHAGGNLKTRSFQFGRAIFGRGSEALGLKFALVNDTTLSKSNDAQIR